MYVIEGDSSYIPDKEFKEKIEKCLGMIKKDAASHLPVIRLYVKKIRAYSKTGANVYKKSIDIARTTFDTSETWLASVLVHESIHIWQKEMGKEFHGQEAEQECNQYQLEALRAVGGSQVEIAHLLAQTGNHFDLNGDGVYDKKDYDLRDY